MIITIAGPDAALIAQTIPLLPKTWLAETETLRVAEDDLRLLYVEALDLRQTPSIIAIVAACERWLPDFVAIKAACAQRKAARV